MKNKGGIKNKNRSVLLPGRCKTSDNLDNKKLSLIFLILVVIKKTIRFIRMKV